MKKLTHGSLSSGIGGFDLGAEANHIKTLWTCEIDPLRRDILKWILPKAKHYHDLRELKTPPYVDIISFGFPCQDISQANPKGEGLEGQKSSLWYAGWDVICSVKPKFIIIENSPILVHKGLIKILGSLAEKGYNAEWDIISCKQFGMPHIRKRLFIVAYSNKIRCKTRKIFQFEPAKEYREQEKEGQKILEFYINVSQRLDSRKVWTSIISKFFNLDDGIPNSFFQGLLAAAGDTVSPKITTWIFSRIKSIL